MTNDQNPLERLGERGERRGGDEMATGVRQSLRRRQRARVGGLLTVVAVAAIGLSLALSGGDDPVDVDVLDDPTTTTAPASSTSSVPTTSTAPVPPPSVTFIADACATGDGRFADAQFALSGTITSVEMRVNPRDVDPENPEYDPDVEPPITPWVWFQADAWFTDNRGVDVPFWMPGFDPAVGQHLLVGGDSYRVWLDETDYFSGEVEPCLAEEWSPRAEEEWNAVFGGSVVAGSEEPEGEPDPAQVALIQAALDRWTEADLQNYSYDLTWTRDPQIGWWAPCGRLSAVRVVVVGGEVVDAVSRGQFCELEDNVVPPVADVFTAAIAAAGATTFDLRLDEGGVVIDYSANDRNVSLSGSVSNISLRTSPAIVGEGQTPAAIEEARAAWETDPVEDYELRVEPICCWRTGPYVVTVEGGVPVRAVYPETGEVKEIDVPNPGPLTIDDFFETITAYNGPRSGVFSDSTSQHFIVLDESGRWPERLYLDWLVNAIDDEQFYEIELTPTDPLVSRVLMATGDIPEGTPGIVAFGMMSIAEVPGRIRPSTALAPHNLSDLLGLVTLDVIPRNQIIIEGLFVAPSITSLPDAIPDGFVAISVPAGAFDGEIAPDSEVRVHLADDVVMDAVVLAASDTFITLIVANDQAQLIADQFETLTLIRSG